MAEPSFGGSFGALQMKPHEKADIPAVRAKGAAYTVAALIEHLRDFPQDVPVYVSIPDCPKVMLAGPFTNQVFAAKEEVCVVLAGVFPENALSAKSADGGNETSSEKSAKGKE